MGVLTAARHCAKPRLQVVVKWHLKTSRGHHPFALQYRQNSLPRGSYFPPRRPAKYLSTFGWRLPPTRRLCYERLREKKIKINHVHAKFKMDLGFQPDRPDPGMHSPRLRVLCFRSFSNPPGIQQLHLTASRTIPTFLTLYIFGFLYQLLLVWDALRMKNTIQVIGLVMYNVGLLIYGAVQISQIKDAVFQLSHD